MNRSGLLPVLLFSFLLEPRNEGAIMRRLIAPIADTTTTALSRSISGWHVGVLETFGLAALGFARLLLTRLTGLMPVGLRVVVAGRMQPAVAVRAGAARHYCLHTLRPHLRRMEPRCGASHSES
jgi:hypothetical protein